MNIVKRNRSIVSHSHRARRDARTGPWNYSSLTVSRALMIGRRRRERMLAWLGLITLVIAWDATLRLDERVSPPRMRMSHAVEVDAEMQTLTAVP